LAGVPTDPSIDQLTDQAVRSARMLIDRADAARRRRERAKRRRFSRLLEDPRAIEVTITLTDEVMRVKSTASAINVFRSAVRRSSIRGFGLVNWAGLRLLARLARLAPRSVVHLVHARVRRLSRDMILPAEHRALQRHVARRRRQGVELNINVLGEAVLGESEADERLERVLEMMGRPEVRYVSVKISSIVSQIITIDHEGSRLRVADRLRRIYRACARHHVFVNLDMEEYRDLRLTLDAFTLVLDEEEFVRLDAGIVLQAYLPESHDALSQLIAWSTARHARSGASIKVRLVKGANLAMEHAEAELQGWSSAPYRSKADVDASFVRLLDVALRPETVASLRVGVASHNLFDVSWSLDVARSRGVLHALDVEMLEGMADAEALSLVRAQQRVLLYTPVTRRDDFASAVAYLVRRLDENTSDENYLRAAFDIGDDRATFEHQSERFVRSVQERHRVSTASLRHAPRVREPGDGFANTPNTDPTSRATWDSLRDAHEALHSRGGQRIPLVIDGAEVPTATSEEGHDPSRAGATWYEYSVASSHEVDLAVAGAEKAQRSWSTRSLDERRAILASCAEVMESERFESLAVMARDAGKSFAEADPEISEAIDFARFYAATCADLEQSRPVGTVVVVPPWNFPYAIPAGGVFAALAAGNAVVLKPAPEAVATAWHLARQIWQGGVPRDVLQFVPTRDDEVGQRLVTHDAVDAVILTGSFDTARLFTRWRGDVNLLAETSGKNAVLVSACADIDVAVKDLVQSAFGHAGQKCSAASLAIVVRDVLDDPTFLRQLSDAVSSLAVGAGDDLATNVGPIIRVPEGALQRALTGLEPGEEWLIEPRCLDTAGFLWRPGVKVGVQPGSWSHLHEWFGPVLGVMVAPDFDTAIAWQNQTDFALTAGLSSLDEGECEHWIDQVQAGNLYVNRATTGAVVARQPFGGWKRSSVGPTAKAGGDHYVHALRNWDALSDVRRAIEQSSAWWHATGRLAIDRSALNVERNFHRYRRPTKPIVVRVDSSVGPDQLDYLRHIASTTGVMVVFSSERPTALVEDAVVESSSALVQRGEHMTRVRWLSNETPPVAALLEHGVSVDRRPLAQRGDVETPRWLLEQSVSITVHRYGNTNGGPKPRCPGLD